MKKKLNLISLEEKTISSKQMKSIKGGGACSCSSQGCIRANGCRRGVMHPGVAGEEE